jgi:subtilisin family serine protease
MRLAMIMVAACLLRHGALHTRGVDPAALLQGLEWVARSYRLPAVVHMSIEGGFNSVVNDAVERLVRFHQLHVVASSGNRNTNACQSSPASAPSAITVAALDSAWRRWSYSNWWGCACLPACLPGARLGACRAAAVTLQGCCSTVVERAHPLLFSRRLSAHRMPASRPPAPSGVPAWTSSRPAWTSRAR